jgi:putative acetyltransferase
MDGMTIRRELPGDFSAVENLTREAFWNLYVPGCDEHFLVHKMRSHPDFIGELDYVAVRGNAVIGNIMFTKSCILQEDGSRFPCISFGPVSVLPEYQRRGVGSALITHTKNEALRLGHRAIIILGSPVNYCKHGFTSSRDFNISNSSGDYPLAQLVCELEKDALKGITGKYVYSDVYDMDPKEVEEFEKTLPPKETGHRYTQDLFSILIRAFIR